MRSKLFVPGSRPELFAKALASQADAISLDLEDSVVESRKVEARLNVRDFLSSSAVLESPKTIIVRVNSLASGHFSADIAAVIGKRLDLLNVPKVESAADVRTIAAAVEPIERERQVDQPTRILVNIESAKALRCAHEIAAAHARVAGLQLGLADLFEPLAIDRRDTATIHAAMLAMRLAAGEAGVFAYDAAYVDIADIDGFRAEATMAKRLGYLGKSCVHPRQIELANTIFQPSAEDIAFSRRVLEAARQATNQGTGAFNVDGRMIDPPFLRRAEAIVAAADNAPREPDA